MPRRFAPRVLVPVTVFAVFLVGALSQLPQHWYPIGDYALVELSIRQITHHLPLIGPYSALRGFSHPSPGLYYLAWLPYQLSGMRSSSILATTLAFNGAGLAIAMWLAARKGAVGASVALLAGITVATVGSGSAMLLLPWNPFVAAVPLLALIIATWRLCLGDRWVLPLAVGLASWCTSSHLGFAPTAVGLALLGTVTVIVREIKRGGSWARRLAWPVAVSVGIALLIWAPTLYDAIRNGGDSNARAIVRFLLHPTQSVVPAKEAIRVLASELSLRPYWAGGPRPYDLFNLRGTFEPPLAPLIIGLGVGLAWRRRATDELVAIGVAFASLLLAFVGLLHVNDTTLLDWYLLPAHMSGIALFAFTAWSLLRSAHIFVMRRSTPPVALRTTRPGLVTAAWLLIAAALAIITVSNLEVPEREVSSGRITAAMIPTIERRISKHRPVVLTSQSSFDGDAPETVVLDLDRAGYDVRVPPNQAYRFGAWRARPATGPVTNLYLRSVGDTSEPPEPGAILVATSAPVTSILLGTHPLTVWRIPSRASGPTR